MIIENSETLKNWLTNYLEPLCEADPQALAKYVMALIKKDRPEKELKSICFDQLEVFLQNQTVSFVEVLFETLNNKSYLTSNNSTNESTNENLKYSVNLTSALSTSSNLTSSVDLPNSNINSSSDANLSTDKTTAPSSSGLNNSQSSSSTKRSHHNRERSRSRSRSRSQSPFQTQSRHRPRDVDMRRPQTFSSIANHSNTRGYFNEDRLRRNWGAPSPRSSSLYYMSHSCSHKRSQPSQNRRSRSKSHSKSKSRSRSRSYSPRSNRSQSRSRSRSKSRNRIRASDAKGRGKEDKEASSSKKTRLNSSSPKDADKEKENSKKRCRDYDEKGFCMRGDLCSYDHGKDPVVLDGNVSSVVLGLAANGTALLPTPGHSINNALPNSYLAEPYNPEAPGIDQKASSISSHQNQRSLNNPHRGPLAPGLPPQFWGPIRAPMKPNLLSNNPASFIPQMPIPGRPRELVGVPTVYSGKSNTSSSEINRKDSNSSINTSQAAVNTSNTSTVTGTSAGIGTGNSGARRGRGRGGFRSGRRQAVTDSADKCTLEVRKIPSNLNTITNLNSYFSKFGTIVNIQVNFEGDCEAALIQFTSHSQALAAYRCTEAVLNNRFIKVFWHSKDTKQSSNNSKESGGGIEDTDNVDKANVEFSSNGSINNKATGTASRVSAKERLGVKQNTNEKMTTALSSSGTISRTVFNPALLKKLYSSPTNNIGSVGDAQSQSQSQPQTQLNPVKPESKKDKLVKKLELQRKRQELLSTYVKEQKLLVEKLTKAKSDKEKNEIRVTVEKLEKQIRKLEEELKKDAQIISSEAKISETGNKSRIQKELLDAEMDFYNRLHKGETTNDLAKKLNELRVKVKNVGLSEAKQAKLMKKYAAMRGSLRGRFRTGHNFASLRKVDRRTRKILILDVKEEDQIDLLSHLAQFAEVETVDTISNGTVVTFKTRAEAEMLLSQLPRIKFKNQINLKGTWFDEAKLKSPSSSKSKQITEKETHKEKLDEDVNDHEELPDDELLLGVSVEDDLLEEEESDEEDESRPWRR